MPNHYHLLVRQEEGGSISRYLQTTFNAYVQYFNVLEGHSGTLFQGPAKSRAIETDTDFLQVVRYIHPIRCWPNWQKRLVNGPTPIAQRG
jgi:REP element-mobilizing transposase RayT